MYTSHFGLSEPPFSIAPDPRYLFMSKRHREALAHLVYGVREGGGFVQLTGEVGTGKTTLCRGFLEQVPDKIDVALIMNPRLSEYELVAALCDELGIEYPRGGKSIKELTDLLNAHLLRRHAEGGRSVLIIDEAQNLSTSVLEQLRLLTNLETNREKLLRIVLIGQPELSRILAQPELRQLNQRITARYHLLPLSADETRAYIQYRLAVAGVKHPLFSDSALRKVYRYSRGIPRLINIICDRALLGAYSRGTARVSGSVVGRAAREVLSSEGIRRIAVLPRWSIAMTSAAVAAALVIVAVLWLQRPSAPDVVGELWSGVATGLGRNSGPDELDEWLADAGGDRNAALASLARLWGVEGAPVDWDTGCSNLEQQQLRCMDSHDGDFERLRQYDRPVLLALDDSSGRRHHVLLRTLGPDYAVLGPDDRQRRFDLELVKSHWRGDYRLVWSAPTGVDRILPGTYSDAVFWLRQRLNFVESVSNDPLMETEDARYFDEGLRQRVMAYQRRNGLTDSGVVDVETMIRLNNGLGSSLIPVLQPPEPGSAG